MMTKIYTNTKNTRVWVRLADNSSDEILVKLAQIAQTVVDHGAFDPFIRMITLHIKDPVSAGQAEDQVTKLVAMYCGRLQVGFAFLYAAIFYVIYMQTFLST